MRQLKAILFDMDGTIVDTEKDGHRVAFNQAFTNYGINVQWGVSQYKDLLKISGGKERIKHFFLNEGKKALPGIVPLDDLVKDLHLLKTELFISLIEDGRLPLRPGIKRLMLEAKENNILIGICTTSNEKAANAIIKALLNDVKIDLVLAGDVVKSKKPDPEIYLLALQKIMLPRANVLVIEDSENGVNASKNAGLKVLVTVNDYTRNEDQRHADAVVTCLGDDDEEAKVLYGNMKLKDCRLVKINDLEELLHSEKTI